MSYDLSCLEFLAVINNPCGQKHESNSQICLAGFERFVLKDFPDYDLGNQLQIFVVTQKSMN